MSTSIYCVNFGAALRAVPDASGGSFENNYGRGHMKPSNEIRSDIQLPLSFGN